jgi:hypothetical protein
MNIDKVVEHFGGRQATADALGLKTAHAIGYWQRDKRIPYPRQCQIQILTGGKFVARK